MPFITLVMMVTLLLQSLSGWWNAYLHCEHLHKDAGLIDLIAVTWCILPLSVACPVERGIKMMWFIWDFLDLFVGRSWAHVIVSGVPTCIWLICSNILCNFFHASKLPIGYIIYRTRFNHLIHSIDIFKKYHKPLQIISNHPLEQNYFISFLFKNLNL